MFVLEALQANEGDCLLLHYGEPGDRRTILIDGGTTAVYKPFLRKRLEALKNELSPAEPLPLEMVMVSHIDGDHIGGIVKMFEEMDTRIEQSKPKLWDVSTLWINTFDEILGNDADELGAALGLGTSFQGAAAIPAGLPVSEAGRLILATVGQGRKLREFAERMSINFNFGFTRTVNRSAASHPISFGDLKLRVIGPSLDQLSALQHDWDAARASISHASPADALAIAADFTDDSVPNLSSIVVVAEYQGKRILLSGDARGDFIMQGLEEAGLLAPGDSMHFDLLKVPHHGSDRDVAPEFFQRLIADHYVFSADGKNGNPDVATLDMLRNARAGAQYTVVFTNGVDQVLNFRQQTAGGGVTTRIREDGELSISVDLS